MSLYVFSVSIIGSRLDTGVSWSGLNGRTEKEKVNPLDENKLVKTRSNIRNHQDDGSRAPEVEKINTNQHLPNRNRLFFIVRSTTVRKLVSPTAVAGLLS